VGDLTSRRYGMAPGKPQATRPKTWIRRYAPAEGARACWRWSWWSSSSPTRRSVGTESRSRPPIG